MQVMSDGLHVDGLDGRLADPGFLVNTGPDEVLGLVDAASGPAARLTGAVYRASARLHGDDTVGARQLLALDAARYGDRQLSARITAVPVSGTDAGWGEWATGSMVDRRLGQSLTGHTSEVEECVDDGGAAFVAAGEALEGVLPGVSALHVGTRAGRPPRPVRCGAASLPRWGF